MTKLTSSLAKAHKVKQALESFFYKVRYNIAIQNALKSTEYKDFRDKLQSAIEKQILYFATIEKVNQITGVHKAVGKLTEIDLLHNLKKHWIPLDTFFKPDDFRDYLLFAAILGGQDALDKMKVTETFDLTNKELISTIKRRAVLSMREIDKTTQSWIARTIEQNYANNHVEIARLLHSQAKKNAEMRSDLIAENELALMMNQIEMETYKRNSVKLHRWITNKDELTCITCMANEEAGDVEIGEMFPGFVTRPPQHERCRCFVMPVISGKPINVWKGK
jgi:hypothetical protein